MKKIFLSVAALTMIFSATLFTSCTKNDTTPPVITLKGNNPMTIHLGEAYVEPGATAKDDKDGDVSSSIIISGTVNSNLKNTYTVTYTVSDAAGNTGTATRTVNVVNSAEYLAGNYHVSDVVTGPNSGTYNYDVTVSTSTTTDNNITIYNFGGFGTAVSVTASLSGNILNIPNQNPSGMGTPGAIQGSGSANTSSIVSISYTADYGGGSIDTGNAAYTKF